MTSTVERLSDFTASMPPKPAPTMTTFASPSGMRPSPVPPYLLAVAEEAWENSWNSLPICSGVMPMPESVTASLIHSRPFSCPCRASIVMVPRSVNLLALLKKFNSAWVDHGDLDRRAA